MRVWRADPAFQLEGEDLPDPPPSVALILAGSQTAGRISQTRNSKMAELEIDARRHAVISGSKPFRWKSRNERPCAILLAAALCSRRASSPGRSGTTAWEMNSYQRFRPRPVRGRLAQPRRPAVAGAQMDTVFTSDQPVIWSVAQAPDGALYAATGHRGRVYRIDRAGKSRPCCGPPTSPRSSRWRWTPRARSTRAPRPTARSTASRTARPTEYFAPKARYIWSLAVGARRRALRGHRRPGQDLSRGQRPGKGELYYETGQSHITGLAIDPQGRLLAGTEPNGILYRITAKDKAFVLYDANLPEIRAIVPDCRRHRLRRRAGRLGLPNAPQAAQQAAQGSDRQRP